MQMPACIEQVLLNLAVNSRDAMQHGGYVDHRNQHNVAVEKGGVAKPGAYVVVTVKDTGTGMDATPRLTPSSRSSLPNAPVREQGWDSILSRASSSRAAEQCS